MTPMSLRAVIVDDEDLARHVLREFLAEHHGTEVEIVAECRNGFEAVKAVSELRPDGFEVLDLVGRDVAVVFVTAFDEYALRAFEVHAVDYLLKPVTEERVAEAVRRVRARLAAGQAAPNRALADQVRKDRGQVDRIIVRDGVKVHVIPVADLDYAEAQDDYVGLRVGGRMLLKEQTLGSLEASLDPRRFVRVHRSFLLNLDRLARIEPYARDSRVAILKDGTELPVSRAGYARLKELL
jgi:two-component system LytT family response regulator